MFSVKIVATAVAGSAVFLVGANLPAPSLDPYACPKNAHLTTFEDGSGACYPDKPTKGERDQYPLTRADGTDWSWDENTFPWDCHTMGNKICG